MYDLAALLAQPGFLEALGQCADAPHGGALLLVRDAKLKLTSRCNLRCQMCKYGLPHRDESLSTAAWRRVLDELVALGCRKVHFSGGEVFLRDDLLELVEHAASLGLKVNLTTNGTLIDRERARRLICAGVNSICLSLDDARGELHDRLRGRPGAFEQSVRAARWLRRYAEARGVERRGKLRINSVVMQANFRRLPEIVQLAGELGAVDHNPLPIDEKGTGARRLSRQQIELYNREIAPRVLELRVRYGFSLEHRKLYPFGVTPTELRYSQQGLYACGFYAAHRCWVPWLHCFCAWNGEVSLCCMTHGRLPALGKLAEQPLREILAGEAARELRASFQRGALPAACQRCDQFLAQNTLLERAVLGWRARQRATARAG